MMVCDGDYDADGFEPARARLFCRFSGLLILDPHAQGCSQHEIGSLDLRLWDTIILWQASSALEQ